MRRVLVAFIVFCASVVPTASAADPVEKVPVFPNIAFTSLDGTRQLDLESFRIGAWRSWENNPSAGFHGALDEVKICRGVLTPDQVAELFAAGRKSEPETL